MKGMAKGTWVYKKKSGTNKHDRGEYGERGIRRSAMPADNNN